MWVSRPVGSPPLKILAGLTCPKPAPCAKTPTGRPSTGAAAAGVVSGDELPHPAQISAAATPQARPTARKVRRAGTARRSVVILVVPPSGSRSLRRHGDVVGPAADLHVLEAHVGSGPDPGHRAGEEVSHVDGLPARRDRDEVRHSPDPDGVARPVSGGPDRGHPAPGAPRPVCP